MKDTRWLDGMHQLDTFASLEEAQGEQVYTLFLRDFLKMPPVDFSQVSSTDVAVRSLFN
jgi:hypothetical protein